jgi:hypothetical protein
MRRAMAVAVATNRPVLAAKFTVLVSRVDLYRAQRSS